MSPAAFEHTCASFRAALISRAQRDDTDDLRAMLDDGYVSVPRDMTRAIRSAALGVALMRACERGSENCKPIHTCSGSVKEGATGYPCFPTDQCSELEIKFPNERYLII